MKLKRRHTIIFWILYWCVGPFLRLALNYRCKIMKNVPAPALIISNHTTNLDPAFVALSFRRPVGFVASEHVSRMGLASSLLRFAFPMIIKQKGKSDIKSSLEMLRSLRSGTNLCLFAEGNKSFNGLTNPIIPATGKLVKASGASLITYRITGGYFASPRWGEKWRRGPIGGYPVAVYTPEQLKEMTAEQINDLIQVDIGEDAYARQLENPLRYKSRAHAEHIERALYLCPACEGTGSLRSSGHTLSCTCGMSAALDEYGYLHGDGLRFETVPEWDAWQDAQTAKLAESAGDGAIFEDGGETLRRLHGDGKDELVGTGTLAIYRDSLHCAGRAFAFEAMSGLSITGTQTLVFTTADGSAWELDNARARSALKYLRIYRHFTGKTM